MTQPFAIQDQETTPKPSVTAWQQAAPWGILGVWLAVDVAVVLYWANQKWGFLQGLPLIIGLALHQLGLTAWVTAYAILADRAWPIRAGYFAAGALALVILDASGMQFHEELEMMIGLGAFLLGLAFPLAILRWRSWKIRNIAGQSANVGRPAKWQFTIGDLLVTTTVVATLLGLLIGSGRFRTVDEIYILAALLVGALAVLMTSLTWRRFWASAAVSSGICAALAILPIVWHDTMRVGEAVLLLIIVSGPVASLLAASGCLRLVGYRLR